MKFTRFITPEDAKKIELDIVSQELKVHLTRLLHQQIEADDSEIEILRQNSVINKSRNLLGLPIYVLESDNDGYYQPAEHAWHNGEIELVFRRLNTVQFAEFICELIEDGRFSVQEVNELLERDGVSFRITEKILQDKAVNSNIIVTALPIEYLETASHIEEHPNVRLLVHRMEVHLAQGDYAGVLHSSASIFETVAKHIINIPSIQNQTLKSFFERYRKDSLLPQAILDYILSVYDRRNTTPLAGHGSIAPPNISKEEAVVISEITKAFIQIEYTLQVNVRSIS